ncbi:chalcone--flavonone isomerase 2-like protein [Cinnamomum micranthum f. kanehirae]|uniref:Chalcone-flavonone isomerase family protein n=1 Tax=Cinnamomum micranthum f. kanehirae TaxID=337451 RepID=A0A3S4NGD2_9MAGN|nr:chalcone--flavonone isomerase 2-like protein [Cinnamomum micranthum f. kanehirae]
MGPLQCVTPVQVESLVFPPAVKPLGSSKTFFLGGAGARGLEIQGKFVKFTAIGVYLEEQAAVPFLSLKWKGKTGHELMDAVDFFRDVVTGPFEKFMQVTMILPLTGQQYSEKVTENCVAYWKAVGLYTEAEAIAVEKFKQVFKEETFPPGSTIFFTLNPSGSLTIGFSKNSSIPEQAAGVIENKQMSEAVLESMIGKHGVSPEAKQSLATRVSQLLKEFDVETGRVKVEGEEGEKLKHPSLSLSAVPVNRSTTDQFFFSSKASIASDREMGPLQCVTPVQVESLVFPPAVKPLGSSKTFFLGGAGARGLEIQGKFVKFTAIGVYLEEQAVPLLSPKWKGKTGQELTDAVDFFRDVVTGPFEKFMQVTMILPLTGQQYSEKVTENCVAYWKAVGLYTEAEAIAVEKFKQVFKEETFPPGSTIFFTLNPSGSLTIGFSKDSSIPEQAAGVIENKQMSEAVLESMIGKHGVSPEAKQSLATRVSQLFEGI